MYLVLSDFADLKDNKHYYHEGDIFPHDNSFVSDVRIRELSGSDNLMRKPLIQYVEDAKSEIEAKPAKEGKRQTRRKKAVDANDG